MDIWGDIYVGKRWVEDGGAQRCKIDASKAWHVKTAHKINAGPTKQFKSQWASMSAEVARLIASQLEQLRDELLYMAEYGIKEAGTDETKKG